MDALEGRRYSSYSFMASSLDGVSGQRHALTTLDARGKDPRYPLQWAPEPVCTQRLQEKSFLPLPGIERLSPGRAVRSQTLY
jgi:hypothetical protein